MPKRLKYLLEACAIYVAFGIFRILPLKPASNLGGWLARTLGPKVRVNRVAYRNLKLTMPEKSQSEHQEIIANMWDNLGRTIAEFPHLNRFHTDDVMEIEGLEHMAAMRARDKACVFVSGHFANWELLPKMSGEYGIPVHLVYRHANNPYVERIIRNIRTGYQKNAIPKGAAGAKQLIKAIRDKQAIGMLVDQKMNDGIAIPLLGHSAMTAPAVASLAIKFKCYIVPVRLVRTESLQFKMKIYDPFIPASTGHQEADVENCMRDINGLFSEWIRQNPSQWLWLHKRWPVQKM